MTAPVLKQIELPHGQGAVTLYDWMAPEVRDGRNLVRTDGKGREVWKAKPVFLGQPRYEDCFTTVDWDGAELIAHTWSAFRVRVDLQDGEVTVLEFTK